MQAFAGLQAPPAHSPTTCGLGTARSVRRFFDGKVHGEFGKFFRKEHFVPQCRILDNDPTLSQIRWVRSLLVAIRKVRFSLVFAAKNMKNAAIFGLSGYPLGANRPFARRRTWQLPSMKGVGLLAAVFFFQLEVFRQVHHFFIFGQIER